MSAPETSFRAILIAYGALTALVPAASIAQNAVDPGAVPPYVVFTATHAPEFGLDNTRHADRITFSVEAWATTPSAADAIADQIAAALLAAGVVCNARATGYDAEVGLDATILTADWWA